MQDETTLLDCFNLLAQLQALCEQSSQLCAESRSVCAESQQQRLRSPWPHALVLVEGVSSTALLPDQPVQQDGEEFVPHQHGSRDMPAPVNASPHRDDERVLIEQQIIDRIAEVLDHLPLEQQLHILKVLCNRTVALTRARLNTPLVRSA